MNEQSSEHILLDQIKEIVKRKDISKARDLIDEITNAEIAEVINELSLEEQLTFLRMLKTADAAELFSYLDEEIQKELAQSFSEEWGMKLLQNLQSDELADILDELPSNVTSKILAYTPANKREDLNKLLRYQDDEVGSIMSIDISSINNEYTCEQALNKIRRDYNKKGAELVHYYYVVDNTNKLLGVLTLEEIIFSNPETKIDELYSPVASVEANDKKEYAAQIFSDHDMSVLPVTNKEKRLIGMVTSDEVIDVINEENTEDLYKIAGITTSENDEWDYLKTPWYKLVKNRILWIVITLIFATVFQIFINIILSLSLKNQTLVGNITEFIAFASLIPVIIMITNNSSIQANVTITRAINLQEIDQSTYKKVIFKEIITGLILGFIVGLINFARLAIYYSANGDLLVKNNHIQVTNIIILMIISSIALFLIVFIGTFLGTLIPIIFAKKHKDPSSISTVLISNIINIIAALLMFSAIIVLKIQ
ncbi:magnesium transporter [Mycoplasmopsis columbina]|uniref:magnesium transporter n=1 Tax=Mycoplasmopsis columbina TaxID=114881 RepID=UPI0004A6F2B0|nr:magnesium transporter [Mycoplasmopsis columbina]VEU76955.1 Magnesium transporter mgtE [Mycoplasmopsis columbina]